jgi:SRSO17 transposase
VAGVAIEDALELWASALREVKRRIRPLFSQERVALSAGQFLDGLLGPERRKTGWMRAEAAGDPGPWRQQAILGRDRWEADALRDVVREYVIESLADQDAVLVLDETGFLKQGKSSCGVARQYTGSAGKITNCRIGVFAAYVSRHGHALIDRALYLPKAWTDDPARLAAAHVPPGITFATKPRLALAMIGRAIAAEVPFAWVAADSVYGVGEIETALRRAGKGYVLGVNATHPFNSWGHEPPVAGTAEAIAADLGPAVWRRLSAGEGTKGPRLHDWAYLELADLEAAEYEDGRTGLWTRGLLVRRSIADGERAYFTTWCPAGTTIETLVSVEGRRWARSRTASRPPRTSSASTTTRPAPGTAGTGTSRSSCWPSPCWPRSATTRTRQHPQKSRSGSPGPAGPRPLVGPGAPPHRRPSRAATHPARPRHRLVALATRPPGRRTTLTSEARTATVMLGRALN